MCVAFLINAPKIALQHRDVNQKKKKTHNLRHKLLMVLRMTLLCNSSIIKIRGVYQPEPHEDPTQPNQTQ